ncbi:aminomethyltransferase family protein [Haloquadratum walsbyi]|jgi:aminomethyltransferase (EC 2.1.2.10)|uniref:Folate-binding protein YgfZ n=1 Tax=Haloquadratum walsbyi J07HQW2 TaxID=1238425 RepID=U1NEM2_9EURY|nr:glycine cleavage T C-terminal barrel domain-containing protein [Haloquadratum walsbyi]ERG95465.1 MAG: folate-binding protein YgfZ [Haloquadratum walsbyi J07HQW2]
MTVVTEIHDNHGAMFEQRGGRQVVRDYGRPDRTALAVRKGAGIIERGYGIITVEGDDRVEFVDDTLSNQVPTSDGQGVYALLLDPNGRIEADIYVYNADERLLCFTPPNVAAEIVDQWSDRVFIKDVQINLASEEFAVFGVHGPQSTEKVASVLNGAGAPEPSLTFVRGSMGDEGVTVIAGDNPLGEENYQIVCSADVADRIFETLLTYGLNGVPFGYQVWNALAVEAGTPRFETELADQIPNVLGVRNALDFEKGCYIGQEVVSKVENRGQPSKRIIGLQLNQIVETDSTVTVDKNSVGTITSVVESPSIETSIALALIKFNTKLTDDKKITVISDDGASIEATIKTLPFVEGSAVSARIPTYPELTAKTDM